MASTALLREQDSAMSSAEELFGYFSSDLLFSEGACPLHPSFTARIDEAWSDASLP